MLIVKDNNTTRRTNLKGTIMRAIKITESNREKITAVIDEVQRRAHVRKIDTNAVYEEADAIEKWLSARLYKKDWAGLGFFVDPNAQDFPNAYKGIPESTRLRIDRRPSGWFLMSVSRGTCCSKNVSIECIKFGERYTSESRAEGMARLGTALAKFAIDKITT